MSKKTKYFKKRCLKWKNELGLDCNIYFNNSTSHKTYIAEASLDQTAMQGYIDYKPKMINELSKNRIDEIALEEVCHIMLTPMSYLLTDTYSDIYISNIEHTIIHKIKNGLIPKKIL